MWGYKFNLVECYLGSRNETASCNVMRRTGTEYLELSENETARKISVQTVDEIMKRKKFQPNFIKLCADGFEIKILKGALETIATYQPVLFFQWVPDLLRNASDNPMEIFDILKDYEAYHTVTVYDNFGQFLIRLRIDEKDKLSSLCQYVESGGKFHYYYILVGDIELNEI